MAGSGLALRSRGVDCAIFCLAGAPSGTPHAAATHSDAKFTPTWVRNAVEKAVDNAAKEARADLKGVVKTAVEVS